jgi:hypothetical protein
MNIKKMSPRLFKIVAEELDRVLYHVNLEEPGLDRKRYGYIWGSTNTWHKRKKELPGRNKKATVS